MIFGQKLPAVSSLGDLSRVVDVTILRTFQIFVNGTKPFNPEMVPNERHRKIFRQSLRQIVTTANDHIRNVLVEREGIKLPVDFKLIINNGGPVCISPQRFEHIETLVEAERATKQKAQKSPEAQQVRIEASPLPEVTITAQAPANVVEEKAADSKIIPPEQHKPLEQAIGEAAGPTPTEAHKRIPGVPADFRHFRSITRTIPLLAPERERELAMRWRDHDDEKAMHALVTAYMRRAIAHAELISRNFPRISVDDASSAAMVGLMTAVQTKKFNPDDGSLETYARPFIRSAIWLYVMQNVKNISIKSGREDKKLFFNLQQIKNEVEEEGGQFLSDETAKKIAEILHVPLKSVIKMDRLLRGGSVSLHDPIGEDGAQRSDFMEDETARTPEAILMELPDIIERNHRWALLDTAIDELPEPDRSIFLNSLKQRPVPIRVLAEEHDVPIDMILSVLKKSRRQVKERVIVLQQEAAGSTSAVNAAPSLSSVVEKLSTAARRNITLSLNPDANEVKVDGKSVILSYAEYRALDLLVANRGGGITRETILDHLGNLDAINIIYRLRKKLGETQDIISAANGRFFVGDDDSLRVVHDKPARQDDIVERGSVRFDFTECKAVFRNSAVLPDKEQRLLELFMQQEGQVVPQATIRECFYKNDDATSRNADGLVHRLRVTLNEAGAGDVIRTVRGRGYLFCAGQPTTNIRTVEFAPA